MSQQATDPSFRTHIIIYETPAQGGRTAVPVRISQEWTVVIGYASPDRVWTLFAAAARWTAHVRRHSDGEPEQAQELSDALVQAVTAWHRSARERNSQGWDNPPTGLDRSRPVPEQIMSTAQYAVALTGHASHLAWDLHLDKDPAPALRALLDTAESFRRTDRSQGAAPKSRAKGNKPISPEARVESVKAELALICQPMGERLRENLRTTGHRNLQDELTNTLVRSTLREIRGWYDRYVDAAHALIDPQNLEKELRTLNLDLSDQIHRPRARLRTAACNIEQRRRAQRDGRPQEIVSTLLDAAVALTQAPNPQPEKVQEG